MKRLRLLITSFLVTVAFSLSGQSIQRGVVLEYNEHDKKTPLSNVEIVVSNASSTVSDANGEFVLRFRQLKPGDRIMVRRITKVGYELFNKDAIDQWYIASDDSTPFTIILCKTSTLHQAQSRMVTSAQQKYAMQFEKDQRNLKIERDENRISSAEYDNRLAELQRMYENKLEIIENYIDRFVRIDLSDLSSEEQRVIRCVEAGDFDEAISIYERQNLTEKLQQQGENVRRLDSAASEFAAAEKTLQKQLWDIRQSVLRQIDLLHMQGGADAYDKVISLVRNLAMADTTNVPNMLRYARELHSRSNYEEAKKVYRMMGRSAQQRRDSMNLVRAQCYEAEMLLLQGKYTEGIQMCERCIPLYDSLRKVQSDTLTLLRDEADFYQSLAMRYALQQKFDKAHVMFERSIWCLRTLRLEFRDDYLDSQYATNLSQCAVYMRNSDWGYTSVERCKEAISELEALYLKNPYSYEARLAYAYANLGLIYADMKEQKRNEEALAAFFDAERHYRNAVKRNPAGYLRFLAHSLINLGESYSANHDYNLALSCLEEAVSIYTHEPDGTSKFARQLSMCKYNMGKCYYMLGDYQHALEYDMYALVEMEPIYQRNPEMFRETMGIRLVHLCNVYMALGDNESAWKYVERAMSVNPSYEEIQQRYFQLKKLLKK